ncbi:hypothetical protein GCM10022244_29880 [Streptomyces gulbargensis]|uniref:Uncharacterized protein n=1 Tax=Streptomyces gulbargensis TaxID=364901 RepID=A0ABP7MDD1_9ACTN
MTCGFHKVTDFTQLLTPALTGAVSGSAPTPWPRSSPPRHAARATGRLISARGFKKVTDAGRRSLVSRQHLAPGGQSVAAEGAENPPGFPRGAHYQVELGTAHRLGGWCALSYRAVMHGGATPEAAAVPTGHSPHGFGVRG